MPSINSARYAQRIIQTENHESPSFLRKVHRLDPPHFMVLLVDDVVSRPITPEIHLLSLTMFTQEALVTLICMNVSVSYPNWYELK